MRVRCAKSVCGARECVCGCYVRSVSVCVSLSLSLYLSLGGVRELKQSVCGVQAAIDAVAHRGQEPHLGTHPATTCPVLTHAYPPTLQLPD
eukprot:3861660-Rhodomonas_salina.1